MNSALASTATIAALVLAGIGGLAALLDKRARRLLEIGAVVVEALLLALVASVVVAITHGDKPHEMATFFGYTITTLGLLPAAVILARMETTRWAEAIIGGAALIVPVLILRMHQVHG